MKRILVVDDNRSLLEGMGETLAGDDRAITLCHNAAEAMECVRKDEFAVVVSDLKLPDQYGIELMREIKAHAPDTVIIMVTAYGSIDAAVEAMKSGAFDFVTKPFPAEELIMKVSRALERHTLQTKVDMLSREAALLRQEVETRFHPDGLVGDSPQIGEIKRNIEQLADSRAAVLILGETGTGKELVARAIHYRSLRRDRPFVRVNCAVFNDNLLESELFGHEKGAYTGADKQRLGRFEMAHTGTIFLDEVGDLSMSAQAKLLRVLQEQEFERLGGTETIRVDVRVVAATNRNLSEEIRNGRFREDLFYRLSVVPIQLAPLRERKSDISLLLKHFIEKYAAENHKHVDGFSDEALIQLQRYDWPGNVRELENVVERGVVLTNEREIAAQALPFSVETANEAGGELTSRVETFEKRLIADALAEAAGNTTRAAESLGLSRSTLRYKIEKYEL